MNWLQDDDDFVDMVIADMDFQQPSTEESAMRVPNPRGAAQNAVVSTKTEVHWV